MNVRRAAYQVLIHRSTYCEDEVKWSLVKSWWWVGKGGQRAEIGAGLLTGVPPQMSEPEIVQLALESCLRHVRRAWRGERQDGDTGAV